MFKYYQFTIISVSFHLFLKYLIRSEKGTVSLCAQESNSFMHTNGLVHSAEAPRGSALKSADQACIMVLLCGDLKTIVMYVFLVQNNI